MTRPGRRNKATVTLPQNKKKDVATSPPSPQKSPSAIGSLNALSASKESPILAGGGHGGYGGKGAGIRPFLIVGVLFLVFELVLRGPELLGGSSSSATTSTITDATTDSPPPSEGGGTRGGTAAAAAPAAATTTQRQLPQHTGTCLSLQVGPDPVDPEKRHFPDPTLEPKSCLLYTKPTPYIDLLMKAVVGFPNHGSCADYANCQTYGPYQPIARKYGLDWPPFGYTMVGIARLENFRAAIEEVNRLAIPGAIMELGVWRGGAMIMATAVSKEYQTAFGGTIQRELYVLDAFEEIPPRSYGGSHDFLFNKEQDVIDNFKLYDVYDDNVHFVKGLFKDSVPKLASDPSLTQIAVLRVDGNFYDSYQDSLYHMYGKVPVGGIVIFDDVMSHKPVMQCWLDFKADQGLVEELNRIDVHSAWFRKEKEITIDMSKMRPPQDVNAQ